MSDIQAGDVVQCVADCDGIDRGKVDRVVRVRSGPLFDDKANLVNVAALVLAQHRPLIIHDHWVGYDARRFVKIDAADEQFVQQVRACRPIKKQVRA